jgi:hypothetical protein
MDNLKNILKYATKLHVIDSIKNEDERNDLLKLEPIFKKTVGLITDHYEKDSMIEFLIFVANREVYTLEERVKIGQKFINELN